MQTTIHFHAHDPLPAMSAKIATTDDLGWLTVTVGKVDLRFFALDQEGARTALRELRNALDAAAREDLFASIAAMFSPAAPDATDRAVIEVCAQLVCGPLNCMGDVTDRLAQAVTPAHAAALRAALIRRTAHDEPTLDAVAVVDDNIAFWLSDSDPRFKALYEPLLGARDDDVGATVAADDAGADFTERRLGAALGSAA